MGKGVLTTIQHELNSIHCNFEISTVSGLPPLGIHPHPTSQAFQHLRSGFLSASPQGQILHLKFSFMKNISLPNPKAQHSHYLWSITYQIIFLVGRGFTISLDAADAVYHYSIQALPWCQSRFDESAVNRHENLEV